MISIICSSVSSIFISSTIGAGVFSTLICGSDMLMFCSTFISGFSIVIFCSVFVFNCSSIFAFRDSNSLEADCSLVS